MPDTQPPLPSRSFGKTDTGRAFRMFGLVAVVGVCCWFMLPALQWLVRPRAPGGANGPWVVRPITAIHFGAMAVMTSVTVPILAGPLRRRWEREDAALGTRHDPFGGWSGLRAAFYLKGFLLLLIYGAALAFYLFSWTVIGPDDITQRLPWTTLHHSFADIVSLETIPDGQRSDALSQNGPWFSINLRDGRSITLSDDNEGMTREDLAAVTAFLVKRAGRAWVTRSDLHFR
jgi:hypothetical protein